MKFFAYYFLLCLCLRSGYAKLNLGIKAPSHHLQTLDVLPTADAPDDIPNGMNESLHVEFTVHEYHVELDVSIYRNMYGPGTKFIKVDKDGNEIELPPRYRTFHGKAKVTNVKTGASEVGHATITFFNDLIFQGTILTDEEFYHIRILDILHPEIEVRGENRGHGMVLSKTSDIVDEKTHRHLHDNVFYKSWKKKDDRRRLGTVHVFYDCFDGQFEYTRGMHVGVYTDSSFHSRVGGSDSASQAAVEDIFAQNGVNLVYHRQLNIWLLVGTAFIGSQASGDSPWSWSSGYSINSRLDLFSDWRKQYHQNNPDEKNGMWHLLTNHHAPPGTVGLAWVDVICRTDSGTGISNYADPQRNRWGTETFHTVAHEIGHGYGADHSFEEGQGNTGGIMDYSHGRYDDEVQFNPKYRKNEVCNAIKKALQPPSTNWWQSSTNRLDPGVCYVKVNINGGPSPGPSPTPQPTNPTPQPTNSPPTPRPTWWWENTPRPTEATGPNPSPTPRPTPRPISPTPRPTPRPISPTPRPTPRPTSSSSDEYVWLGTTSYGECLPKCGTQTYRTQVMGCFKKVGENSYQYSFDETLCDAANKPRGKQEPCTLGGDVPACNDVCGDGYVTGNEVCDTKDWRGECCKNDCTGYKEDFSCWLVNPVIDAAFMNNNQQVYKFQGPYFARYSNYQYGRDTNKPDDGFPKLISSSFNIKSWTRDFTAIGYKSDQEIFVFKGMQYIKMDFTNGQLVGDGFQNPRNVADDFDIAKELIECGRITGAICQQNTMTLFCDSIYGGTVYDSRWRTDTTARSVSDFNRNGERVVAVYNRVGYTNIYIFSVKAETKVSGFQIWDTPPQGIFTNSDVKSLEDVEAQSCLDENCISCNGDVYTCTECGANYTLYGNHRCFEDNVLSYLDCDNTDSSTDSLFTTSNLDDFTYVSGVAGISRTAISFDGQTKLELTKPQISEKVNQFSVTFRFKPTSLDGGRFLTVDSKVMVSLSQIDETRFEIVFQVVDHVYQSGTKMDIYLNEWSSFEIGYQVGTFFVNINDEYVKLAYDSNDDLNMDLTFDNWYIGDNQNGIVGALDQFKFSTSVNGLSNSQLSKTKSSKKDVADEAWFLPVMIVLGVAILLGFIFSIYCCAKKKRTSYNKDEKLLQSSDPNYVSMDSYVPPEKQ